MESRNMVRAFAVTLAAALSFGVAAQPFPAKPARLLIGYSTGGVVDILGRTVAQGLSEVWHQPVVPDNIPGASTIIMAERCKRSAADGYTLCLVSADTFSLNPHLYSKLSYTTSDFVAVTSLVQAWEVIVVTPSLNVKTVQELASVASGRPGQLNYSSFGTGGLPHLVTEMVAQRLGVKMTHVPFKGAPPALHAIVSGEVHVMYAAIANVLAHIQAGKLVPITVAGQSRTPVLPTVPSFSEVGLDDIRARAWFGLAVPAGTPQRIVQKIHADVVLAFQKPSLKQFFEKFSLEPLADAPEEFARFLKADYERGRDMVKRANVRLD